MRAPVWRWLNSWDGNADELLERYHTLRAVERRLAAEKHGIPIRQHACRLILFAAYGAMPACFGDHRPNVYSPRSHMAAICFGKWLGLRHYATITYLRRHQAEKFFIYDYRKLPSWTTLAAFESRLQPDDWERFLSQLRNMNAGLADGLEAKLGTSQRPSKGA